MNKKEATNVRVPDENARCFNEEQNSNDARCFKSAFVLFADFEALQKEPESACSCNKDVLPPATKEEQIDEMIEEEMLIMEAHQNWAELQDLLAASPRRRKLDKAGFDLPKLPPMPEYNPATWEDELCERAHILAEAAAVYEQEERAKEALAEFDRNDKKNMRGKRCYTLQSFLPSRPVRQPRCPHRVKILAEQPPFCYSLALLDREGKVRETKTYFGEAEDVAENFIMTVLNIAETYLPTLSPGVIMKDLTEEQLLEQEMATECYLCGGQMEDDRVRDHDHLTGEFLGMAHDDCNLARKERFSLTCFTHNFSGYDSHFLIRALSRFPERIKSIDAIPLTTQKFKSITINRCIKFVDSCAFLPDSLDNLVKTLVKSGSTFPVLEQLVTGEKKQLLMEKGVYPYSFATSIKRLKETTHLPGRIHFYSDLHMKECEEKEYARAQQVWSAFDCSNMLAYTSLYLQTDVFLLAEVVMDFRENIWGSFGLDMCSYLSLPHLSFDSEYKLVFSPSFVFK